MPGGYRGRLIWPVVARIARLDPSGTAADPDAAGPLTSGFDADFREPVKVPVAGSTVGATSRKELADLDLPVQVEDAAWEALEEMRTGDASESRLVLVFHFADLEARALVDPTTGDALAPRKGDRLVAILDPHTNAVVQAVTTPPGLYVTEARPASFGLSARTRNLLLVTFESRDQSVRGAAG